MLFRMEVGQSYADVVFWSDIRHVQFTFKKIKIKMSYLVLCIISLIPANLTLIIWNGIPPFHSEILVEKIQFFIQNRSSITLFYVKK